MGGPSEDFSGLPEYKSRDERRGERLDRRLSKYRSDPNRGHRTKVLAIGAFILALLLVAGLLVVLYAPAPYLGVSHGALASSVDGSSGRGCRPSTGHWICWKGSGEVASPYWVTADWAGCWSGKLLGPQASPDAQPETSGCVSVIDHITAD